MCWKFRRASIRHRIAMWSERRSYCSRRKASPTTSLLLAWIRRARLSASGASDSPSRGFLAWSRNLGAGVPPSFPPSVVVQVKALACELPHRLQLPLSRLSLSEIRREVITQGLVAEISGATLWRWLSADALRPWRHRSWIFPRDPDFAAKAGRILDLYDRVWQGRALSAREFVISSPSPQAADAISRTRSLHQSRTRILP